jgi:hypothetical protein
MVAPTFLGIGAMKAGTTTVYSYFRAHPHVFVPKIKELNWFDLKSKISKTDYEKMFPTMLAVRGEITPIYRDRLPIIAATYPDIKLILCTRDPVDRFVSALRHLRTKAKARNMRDLRYLYDIDAIIAAGHRHFVMQQGYYQKTVETVFSKLFAPCGPRQRLHVIDFNRLVNNQQMVWDELCGFLNVPTFASKQFHSHSSNRVAYEKVTITNRQRATLEAFYKPSNDFMRERYHVRW